MNCRYEKYTCPTCGAVCIYYFDRNDKEVHSEEMDCICKWDQDEAHEYGTCVGPVIGLFYAC